MKKILGLEIIVSLVLVFLAGCSSTTSSIAGPAASTSSLTATPTPAFVLTAKTGLSMKLSDDTSNPYMVKVFVSVTSNVANATADNFDVEVTFFDASNSVIGKEQAFGVSGVAIAPMQTYVFEVDSLSQQVANRLDNYAANVACDWIIDGKQYGSHYP